jgi:3-deoxy-D-manno-octulosonate 8-phosphate phosphatase (KDO 8-P phosphatase)
VNRGRNRSLSSRSSLVRQLNSLALIVFDFDGVLTDNRVLVTDDGREAAWCDRSDGLGLAALRRIGVPALILSTETNPIVSHRARKLQTECIHGSEDKWAQLSHLLQTRRIDPAAVAYVGNDINDLDCLRHVGLPIAVADAYPPVRKIARLITERPGGFGAVREICDLIVRARGEGS